MSLVVDAIAGDALGILSRFRVEFHECLSARQDALFEFTDAVLCADGPGQPLVELSLVVEHRRGPGALYGALDGGWTLLLNSAGGHAPCLQGLGRARPACLLPQRALESVSARCHHAG